MAPFQYQSGIDPRVAGTMADLMLRRGDIRAREAASVADANARAAEVGGQAWAGAAQNIGQTIAAIPGQIERAKTQALDNRKKVAEIDDLKAQADQRTATANKAKAVDEQNAYIDQVMAKAMKADPQTGVMSFDRPTFEQGLVAGGKGHLYPSLSETLDKLDASAAKRNTENRTMLAHGLLGIEQAGYTPESVLSTAAYLKANGVVKADQLLPVQEAMADDPSPENIKRIVSALATNLPQYQAEKDASAKRTADIGKTKAETDKAEADAAKARNEIANPKGSAEQDDQRYRDIIARKELKQPITAADAAWATGYEHQKTLGVDTTASAAATRQANAISAQTAQQARAQGFTEAQAGRKELTDKVEAPYRQAQQSAQELRDLVHAAQGGNKEAASLQALQATMSMVRANGLNRLNQAEMKLPEGAGSVWDRVAGKVGKLTSGQPIDASLQKDLLDLADLMEKGAYNRYQTSHKDITSRYKLTDEKPADPPAGYFSIVAPDGKTYTFASQQTLDAFKRAAGIK